MTVREKGRPSDGSADRCTERGAAGRAPAFTWGKESGERRPIPVLLYHRIIDDQSDRFAVSPRQFREHLRMIQDDGRIPITISQLAEGIRGQWSLPERAVAITFDDGFDDTVAALECLESHDMSSTLYVTAGSVGRPGRLSGAELTAIARLRNVELGAHSVSHPRLDELARGEVAVEVCESKDILEESAQMPVDTFAYPHGAYDKNVRAAVIEAGFGSAAAVKNALSHPFDDPWAVARYTVTFATPGHRIRDVLNGRGAPLAWRRERVRTTAARGLRRRRRQLRRKA